MIDRSHDLSLVRQAELLKLSRSSLYYEPQAVPAADLAVMRRIDALHMDYPFAGIGPGVASRDRISPTFSNALSTKCLLSSNSPLVLWWRCGRHDPCSSPGGLG
jgi:hypothetical protein